MESGYEPKTGICWSFGNKGDNSSYNKNSHYHCRPACTTSNLHGEERQGQYESALFGRCRSGKRWFWSAQKFNKEAVFGWADTEEQAIAAVMDAVRSLKTDALHEGNQHVREWLAIFSRRSMRLSGATSCAGYELCEDNRVSIFAARL